LQRLPPHRIQRPHELDEVDFQEHPAPAGLGAGDEAALGARAQLLGVHMEEGGGFIQVQGPQWLRTQAEPQRRRGVRKHENDLVWFRSFRVELSRVAVSCAETASEVHMEFRRKLSESDWHLSAVDPKPPVTNGSFAESGYGSDCALTSRSTKAQMCRRASSSTVQANSSVPY